NAPLPAGREATRPLELHVRGIGQGAPRAIHGIIGGRMNALLTIAGPVDEAVIGDDEDMFPAFVAQLLDGAQITRLHFLRAKWLQLFIVAALVQGVVKDKEPVLRAR